MKGSLQKRVKISSLNDMVNNIAYYKNMDKISKASDIVEMLKRENEKSIQYLQSFKSA